MIGRVDGGLLGTRYELDLVLDTQNLNFCSFWCRFCTGRICDGSFDSPRISLITILALQCELHTLTTLQRLEVLVNLLDSSGRRTIPYLLAPTFGSTVQRIRRIVGFKLVGLPVQTINLPVFDSIGYSTNVFTKIGCIV